MRLDKERRAGKSHRSKRLQQLIDEREGETTLRGPPSALRGRGRVHPETRMSAKESSRRKTRSKKSLRVDTKVDEAENINGVTPQTQASTPASTRRDLRSPGQPKTPSSGAVPDFITQTDKYGNASTPRTADAIQQAQVEHDAEVGTSENAVEVCTETLLDSIRIMCCCLLPDDAAGKSQQKESSKQQQLVERPRLLPKLHPDDKGKKCLVLDLDETLVHSSFRAVPGADFVIPVQVRPLSLCSLQVLPGTTNVLNLNLCV